MNFNFYGFNLSVSDWSEPDPDDGNEDDKNEIFVGYFEQDEDFNDEEDEPQPTDPRLREPIGIYRNLEQHHLETSLNATEMQWKIAKVIKQETPYDMQTESTMENEKLTAYRSFMNRRARQFDVLPKL